MLPVPRAGVIHSATFSWRLEDREDPRRLYACKASWRSFTRTTSFHLAILGFPTAWESGFLHGVLFPRECSKRLNRSCRPLKVQLLRSHGIASATFCWSMQVTGQPVLHRKENIYLSSEGLAKNVPPFSSTTMREPLCASCASSHPHIWSRIWSRVAGMLTEKSPPYLPDRACEQ